MLLFYHWGRFCQNLRTGLLVTNPRLLLLIKYLYFGFEWITKFTMKKTILTWALVSVLFTACSSNDDDTSSNTGQTTPTSTQYFHPPAWIQGTWTSGSGSSLIGFKFSADDIVFVSNSIELSYKTTFNQYNNASAGTCKATETTTSENYDVNMVIVNQTQVYKFKKISGTRIQWLNPTSGAPIYYDKQ